MNNQSTTVRAAQQIAAAGCLPQGLEQQITNGGAGLIGARNPVIRAQAFSSWSGTGQELPGGVLSGGVQVPDCDQIIGNPDAVPGGRYIYVQLQYEQILPLIDVQLGVSDGSQRLTIRRGVLVVSQSLEER